MVPSSGGGTKLIRMLCDAGVGELVGLGEGDSCALRLLSSAVVKRARAVFFVMSSAVETSLAV
jgi:hypothetical protein